MSATAADYRVGRHVVYRLHVHLVLVTKYRRGVISERVRELLIATAGEVCGRHGAAVTEADGGNDHLHLLVDYPPTVALSRLVGSIKTNTSRVVREQEWPEITEQLWGEHFWSPSYFAVSTGGAALDRVAAYVRAQREPNKPPGRPATTSR